MEKLITVIVPIYNVENYLKRCVDSIIQQKYNNLEIILVDDGSDDNSGKLCDEYTHTDSRIIVIHKENGGLSDARNAGIAIAKGEYISFVDSDDWIELDMISTLADLLVANNAELAVCEPYYVYGDYVKNLHLNGSVFILNKIDAIGLLIEDRKFRTNAWNKLYARRLFENIRFPIGKYYEDIYIMHMIYDLCSQIIFVNRQLYYYFQRNESIVHMSKLEPLLDFIEGSEIRYLYLIKKYPELEKKLSTAVIASILSVFRSISIKKINCNNEQKKKLIVKFKEFNRNTVIINLAPRLKMEYILFFISVDLFYLLVKPLDNLYRLIQGGN